MRLSIIVPTRNEASTIGGAIAQFAPFFEKHDLEVVVSDANSTDATAEIVENWARRCPGRVLLAQKPGKQNIAIGRNLGAACATGDVLFHTDADVRLPDVAGFLQKVEEYFADPRLVAATAPIRVYPERATAADRFYHFLMNTTIRLSMLVGWCLCKGECQIVRRAAFEEIGGYDERLVAGEDCNLFYRLQKAGRVVVLSELAVHHSPRRFRRYGYWKISYQYFMEGMSRLLTGRSFAREWRVVR